MKTQALAWDQLNKAEILACPPRSSDVSFKVVT